MRNSRQVAAANVKTWKDEYADETANVSRQEIMNDVSKDESTMKRPHT